MRLQLDFAAILLLSLCTEEYSIYLCDSKFCYLINSFFCSVRNVNGHRICHVATGWKNRPSRGLIDGSVD